MDDNTILDLVYAKATARKRRRAQSRAAFGGALLVVVIASVAALVSAHKPRSNVVADDSSTPRGVSFNGVVFDLPHGWTVAKPSCGTLPDKTVTVGTWDSSCGASLPQTPTTAVQLTDLFGPQRLLGALGTPIDWHGQDRGMLNEEQRGDLHVVTLYLPRLNAVISAQSSDLSTARHLTLDDAHAQEVPDPGLLADTDHVFIQSFAGTDGDGLNRSATITNTEDIAAITGDLRALPTLDRMTPLCDPSQSPQSATITLTKGDQTQTFAARFDDCAQVTSGNGEVSSSTAELHADVNRLVPNSGIAASSNLSSVPRTPSCETGRPESGVRPSTMFFGCATSADNLSDMKWTTWTATTATGTATHEIQQCLRGGPNPPACSDGGYVSYPVNVTLSNPGYVKGDYVFRTITLSARTSGEPAEATTLFCGPPGNQQHHCDVPTDSWGYASD